MPVPADVSRLSAAKRPSTRYLTRHGSGWRFQIRIPADLKKYLRISFFRCSIGPMSIRDANRKAKILAVAAESLVSKVRARAMQFELDLADTPQVWEKPDYSGFDITPMMAAEWAGFCKAMMLSLDMAPVAPMEPSPYLDGLRELILLNQEFKDGPPASPYLVANEHKLRQRAVDAMRPHTKSLASEGDKSNVRVDTATGLIATMERLVTAFEAKTADMPAPPAESGSKPLPTFRDAADAYIAIRIKAAGGQESGDVHSIRFRSELFATLIGDRPLDQYGVGDIQDYIMKLQFWPPERDGIADFDGKTAEEILQLNAKHKYGVLAKNTLTGHYLADVKAIVALASSHARIQNPLANGKLIYPKIFKAPERRKAPGPSKITDAFLLARDSGQLHKAMGIPLGYFTARRVGLLAALRGPDIRRVGEFVVAKVRQHRLLDDGSLDVNGYKTDDSLDGFILHDFFDKIGFVDWAMAQPGYLFPQMQQCADPEDALQKAVNGVLKKAKTSGSFHGFRGLCLTAMRNASVSEYSSRVQSGHAAIDEHEEYGDLPVKPEDAPKLAHLPYPPGFDIDDYMGLDFDALMEPKRAKRKT